MLQFSSAVSKGLFLISKIAMFTSTDNSMFTVLDIDEPRCRPRFIYAKVEAAAHIEIDLYHNVSIAEDTLG